VSLVTTPNSSGGSSISLLSTGSAASLTGLKSGSRHSFGGGGASMDPSSPKIPLMNSRRSRLQAASRRK
jgi:hypothetical protein